MNTMEKMKGFWKKHGDKVILVCEGIIVAGALETGARMVQENGRKARVTVRGVPACDIGGRFGEVIKDPAVGITDDTIMNVRMTYTKR